MFKADVYDRLAEMQSEILASGHLVITQAGCHPGLVAPLMKYAAQNLAQVHSARVFMAFGSFFDSPSSWVLVKELNLVTTIAIYSN